MFYLGMMPKAAELDTTNNADSVDWVAKGELLDRLIDTDPFN